MGLRLDWLGSEALSWRDLLVIVTQSPADSAIVRAIQPEAYSRSQVAELAARVELLAVLLQRATYFTAVNDVKESALPHTFEDLFAKAPSVMTDEQESGVLAAIAAYEKAWEVAGDGVD